jgi:hypothetical protein
MTANELAFSNKEISFKSRREIHNSGPRKQTKKFDKHGDKIVISINTVHHLACNF